jgi:hypothetical protein
MCSKKRTLGRQQRLFRHVFCIYSNLQKRFVSEDSIKLIGSCAPSEGAGACFEAEAPGIRHSYFFVGDRTKFFQKSVFGEAVAV